MSDAVADKIRDALANNPDPTVQTTEHMDRRVTRHNPKDLIDAAAALHGQTHRATRGIVRPVRMNHPTT